MSQIKMQIPIIAFTVPVTNINRNNFKPTKQQMLRIMLDMKFKQDAETVGLKVDRVRDFGALNKFFDSL